MKKIRDKSKIRVLKLKFKISKVRLKFRSGLFFVRADNPFYRGNAPG